VGKVGLWNAAAQAPARRPSQPGQERLDISALYCVLVGRPPNQSQELGIVDCGFRIMDWIKATLRIENCRVCCPNGISLRSRERQRRLLAPATGHVAVLRFSGPISATCAVTRRSSPPADAVGLWPLRALHARRAALATDAFWATRPENLKSQIIKGGHHEN
jgi:hypothetical protein